MDVAYLPSLSTYGRPIAQRDFGGFALGLGVHRPHEVIPAHRHEDEYQWCLTLEGGFEESAGQRRETCGPGSMLVRPPDCVHADRFTARRGLCLNLFPRRSWLIAHGFDDFTDAYHHQRTRNAFELGRSIAQELQHADTTGPLAVESLVIDLLTSTARMDAHMRDGRSRWLAAALDRIEGEPSAELTLTSLAADVGISAGHLARAFRSNFGKSVGAYVRERRIARAAALMRQTASSLAAIAAACGFCDQAHFSRAFKAQFGATPAAFRQQLSGRKGQA